jgi:hypothetical protein
VGGRGLIFFFEFERALLHLCSLSLRLSDRRGSSFLLVYSFFFCWVGRSLQVLVCGLVIFVLLGLQATW